MDQDDKVFVNLLPTLVIICVIAIMSIGCELVILMTPVEKSQNQAK